MLNDEIEIFDLPVPKEINTEIINYLGNRGRWSFVFDGNRSLSPQLKEIITPGQRRDHGMAIISYSRNNDEYVAGQTVDPYLNHFGDWIYFLCKEKSKLKFQHIERMYWNLYSPGASSLWHLDKDSEGVIGHYGSIGYNLHSNDGETEFEGNQKVPAKEGQAVVFPSHLRHRGVAPKKNKWRLSLNIVAKIQVLHQNYYKSKI